MILLLANKRKPARKRQASSAPRVTKVILRSRTERVARVMVRMNYRYYFLLVALDYLFLQS